MIRNCIGLIMDGVITTPWKSIARSVGPCLDIHVGNEIWIPSESGQDVIDPEQPMDTTLARGKTSRLTMAGYTLRPGKRCIVWSSEFFDMPKHLSGLMTLRSRCAQAGLDHSFSGMIQPGWCGRLALELTNINPADGIIIRKDAALAQVCFFHLVG